MSSKNNNTKKQSKSLMKVTSVFIAVILWMAIGFTKDPVIDVSINNVPIDYVGISKLEDKGLTIVDNNKQPEMSLTLNGRRSELMRVLGSIHASVDVSNVTTPATYNMNIDIKLPLDSVNVTKRKISSLDVVVSPIIEKSIPIKIKQVGHEKLKQTLVKSLPIKESIVITGSEIDVAPISYALVTVDVSEIKENSNQKYKYELAGSDLSVFPEAKDVKSSDVDVFISNSVYKETEIGVDIIIPDAVNEKYQIVVKNPTNPTITVGIKDDSIINKPFVTFQSKEYIAGMNQECILPVESYDDIYIPESENEIKFRIDVDNKIASTLNIPINIINKPANLSAELDKSSVDVSLVGVPNNLTADKIKATVDLAGISDGIHDVKIVFSVPDGVIIKNDYKLKVSLQ